MNRLVLLLEEESAQVLLDSLLPRLFPSLSWLCLPHDGKTDLDRAIRKRLPAWREPGARFVILRDNDGGDCHALKQSLVKLCGARKSEVLVRIACQEIEAWYFGEPEALAAAYGRTDLLTIGGRKSFRNPDAIRNPAAVLERLIPDFRKVDGARRIAPHLSRERNRSRSFQIFLAGVESIAAEMTQVNTR